MPAIELIVATAHMNVIGYKGEMPWGYLPKDLEYFKETTMGHSVVIGYNTLLSISKMRNRNTDLLPGRRIYVLTHDPNKIVDRFPGCIPITSIETVIRLATRGRVFVAGGQSAYLQFVSLPQTRVIHQTRIHADYVGDAFFPEILVSDWYIRDTPIIYPVDIQNKHAMSFTTWRRRE